MIILQINYMLCSLVWDLGGQTSIRYCWVYSPIIGTLVTLLFSFLDPTGVATMPTQML